MILTITAFKGGVGKTTTAVHLAAYLNQKAPTILIDGDLNRSAMLWASHEKLSFPVVDEREGLKASRQYDHIVIDTPARPDAEEIKSLGRGCDLLLLPGLSHKKPTLVRNSPNSLLLSQKSSRSMSGLRILRL
jgi:chromosome partitioning protein